MGMSAPDRARCIEALDKLLQSCEGISAAMLTLRDGRQFVEKAQPGVDCGRFAAMASSLVALGHSVLSEVNVGALDHVLVEGTEGKLVMCSVPGTGGLLLLAVMAEKQARLGLVLGHARICAQAVSASIPRKA